MIFVVIVFAALSAVLSILGLIKEDKARTIVFAHVANLLLAIAIFVLYYRGEFPR